MQCTQICDPKSLLSVRNEKFFVNITQGVPKKRDSMKAINQQINCPEYTENLLFIFLYEWLEKKKSKLLPLQKNFILASFF